MVINYVNLIAIEMNVHLDTTNCPSKAYCNSVDEMGSSRLALPLPGDESRPAQAVQALLQ